MAEQPRRRLHGPGHGRGPGHPLPRLRAQGRAGGQPGQRRPQAAARRHPADRLPRTSAAPTSTWSAAARPRPRASILGHEITGEVIESAPTSSSSRRATSVSVPFNIACGRCRNCKEGNTGICLNVNPDRPGSAYGYVDMGGWVGGQAEYVLVPYADWNLLKFPDKDQAMEKILDLTMLSDIFPTGFHGAYTARVGPGSTVYVAGAGPVGLAAAVLGAAARRRGRHRRRHERRAPRTGARASAARPSTSAKGDPQDQIEQILGVPEVDARRRRRRVRGPRRTARTPARRRRRC